MIFTDFNLITGITNIKIECKILKKYCNPDNLSLMQIQHLAAKFYGFKNWSDLLLYFNHKEAIKNV